MEKTIIIGSDHAAYPLKEKLKTYLFNTGMIIEDAGTYSEDSVDYPDFGKKVASAVSGHLYTRGILLCGTGIGMSIVANRFKGVRAALCHNTDSAFMSRRHNDSNILVLGGRVIEEDVAIAILVTWLETSFEGGRHQDRLSKIDEVFNERSIY